MRGGKGSLLHRALALGITLAMLGSAGVPASAQVLVPQVLGNGVDSEPSNNIFPQPDRQYLLQLVNARKLIEQARYSEAVRLLGELLRDPAETGGPGQGPPEDCFFQPDRNVPNYRSLKAEARRLIGELPAKGRELYEMRYGAQAQALLDEAVARGDRESLAKVSRCFFHTQAGYEATLLLGLYHFDHGRPLAAALTLKRLREIGSAADAHEPVLSLALATSWLQAGRPIAASETLLALKRRMSGRDVEIAGKRVPWFEGSADAVTWLSNMIGPQLPTALDEPSRWVMFRGNAARNAATAGGTPLLNMRWRTSVASRVPDLERQLEEKTKEYREQGLLVLPSFHPLAVEDVVLMRTTKNLWAVDFLTGKLLWEVPVDDPFEAMSRQSGSNAEVNSARLQGPLEQRLWYDVTYGTLSSDGHRVYSIEGLDLAAPNRTNRSVFIVAGQVSTSAGRKMHNRLAATDIQTGKLKWALGGPNDEYALREAETFFLGPPLPLMGHLYVLAERRGAIRLLALEAKTGDLLWSQRLAMVERDVLQDPMRRYSGVSPSYADGILVCPTSSGAVVAVDLASRSLLWGYQYARDKDPSYRTRLLIAMATSATASTDPNGHWRDSGAVVADGRVLVSPVESDMLHCLDLVTGELKWRLPRGDDLYVACVDRDKVVLVGRRQLRAVSLSEAIEEKQKVNRIERTATERKVVEDEVTVVRPKSLWTRPLPEGSIPSGRGFYADGRYFLPLSSAEVATIDLASGEITHTAKSREGRIPGNLICYKGKVISQGSTWLETFYQLSTARDEAQQGLAADPDDSEALALRGEILLDEGKRAEALECFRRAYTADKDPRTRVLLRDALLDGLRTDFAAHRDHVGEIEALLDDTAQRATFLRCLAQGLQASGQWKAAFEQYVKLIELDQDNRQIEDVAPSLSVRRDRWLQAQLASLRKQADAESVAEIDAAVNASLQEAIDADTVDDLREFLAYYDAQPSAAKARRELIRKLRESAQSGELLEAELLLWDDYHSNDPTVAGPAAAELADMLRQANRVDNMEACYRRLNEEFGEVICRDGKTGRELVDALPDEERIRVTGGAHRWPTGHVKVDVAKTSGSTTTSGYSRWNLAYGSNPKPFFADTAIRLDYNRRQLVGRDGLGKQQFEIPLTENGARSSISLNYNLTRVNVCGHFLVLAMQNKIVAIDALGSADKDSQKVLWHQEMTLPNGSSANILGMPIGIGGINWGWQQIGIATLAGGMDAGRAVTSRYLAVQKFRNVHALDPLSGDTLWTRRDVAPGTGLFGDDEMLFLLPPDKEDALVLRARDGELLGHRKVPRAQFDGSIPDNVPRPAFMPLVQNCLATLGRNLLLWHEDGEKCRLEFFDPWQQKRLWPERVFDAGAKCCLVEHEAVGIYEPDGRFVLVSLADGRSIVDAQLTPLEELTQFFVFRSSGQYIVVTDSPQENPGAAARPIQHIPGPLFRFIVNGRVYAFGQDGKASWPEPAKIENQQLLMQQPKRLPLLAFASLTYQPGVSKQKMSVLCIDKRSGRRICEEEFENSTRRFDLLGDPSTNSVKLFLQNQTINMTFTDDPVPESKNEETAEEDKKERQPDEKEQDGKEEETAVAEATPDTPEPPDTPGK